MNKFDYSKEISKLEDAREAIRDLVVKLSDEQSGCNNHDDTANLQSDITRLVIADELIASTIPKDANDSSKN